MSWVLLVSARVRAFLLRNAAGISKSKVRSARWWCAAWALAAARVNMRCWGSEVPAWVSLYV